LATRVRDKQDHQAGAAISGPAPSPNHPVYRKRQSKALTDGPHGCGQGRDELLVGCRRLDEGVPDGDVGGHTPGGGRVEAITVLAD